MAAILMAAMAVSGCGLRFQKPWTGAPPEATIAVYGRAVIRAADSAFDQIERMENLGQLPPEDATVAYVVIGEIAEAGIVLAEALDLVQNSRSDFERTQALGQVRVIVRLIQDTIRGGLVPVGTQGGRQRIADTLGLVTDVLFQLALALPPELAGAPPTPAPPPGNVPGPFRPATVPG